MGYFSLPEKYPTVDIASLSWEKLQKYLYTCDLIQANMNTKCIDRQTDITYRIVDFLKPINLTEAKKRLEGKATEKTKIKGKLTSVQENQDSCNLCDIAFLGYIPLLLSPDESVELYTLDNTLVVSTDDLEYPNDIYLLLYYKSQLMLISMTRFMSCTLDNSEATNRFQYITNKSVWEG